MTYFPPDTQNGTIDPFPPTIVTSNDAQYEYARRYGTIEDPPDLGSIATGKIALLGIHTTPSFYKSIDIVVGIASNVTQHASVHSEPYLFTGITTIANTRLKDAWHFRADPFTGTVGIGSTFGVQKEYGFAFSKPGLAISSYGFYYGIPGSPSIGGTWGTFIDRDDVLNYFKDLVLIGVNTSAGIGTTDGYVGYEPILQVRNGTSRRGLYVEHNTGMGLLPDSYRLHVDGGGCRFDGITLVANGTDSGSTSSGALVVNGGVGIGKKLYTGDKLTVVSNGYDVTGNSIVRGTLQTTNKLTVSSNGCDVTGNSLITGTLDVTSTITAPTFSGNLTGNVTGNVTGTASGNKLLAAFDIPHVTKKGKRIRHIITEGPEAGIYIRGKLEGKNVIELPEYWDGLVDPESITVSLTQIGYSQDLIVDGIEWGKTVKIKSGNGANIKCYYEVWAARWLNPMDHDEKLHVVYEGETPDDYPGNKNSFLVGGWDYDRRYPKWG